MTEPPQIAALIVAAGRGQRAGGGVPKQWRLLRGKTVAAQTVTAFQKVTRIARIVLVLHPDEMERASEFPGVTCVAGGDSRTRSVRAGLDALADHDIDQVLIHDVARPLVPSSVIHSVLDALRDHPGAAPALAVTDALWRGHDGYVQGSEDRTGLYRAQTPQGFHFAAILAAHRAASGDAADDVEVARAAGIPVAIVPGDEQNLKLTWPADFDHAAQLLEPAMDVRIGNGFDVHRFGPGDHVVLCGVAIPFDHGLDGHSDADVAMHAATDAIYGALAEGDIGRHFPPSEAQWKGADSALFLRHAVDLTAQKGARISNLDITIICEQPKIGPHAAKMQARMADITGLAADRISVKATTSERLGFIGRGEGIASLASATVVSL